MTLPFKLENYFYRPYPTAILSYRDYKNHIQQVLDDKENSIMTSVWGHDTKATINSKKYGKYSIIALTDDKTNALGQPTNLKHVYYPLTDTPVFMLAQEYARASLEANFARYLPPKHKSFGDYENNDDLMKWQPPIFFSQTVQNENMVYIDLKSAYANFYERLSLDMQEKCMGRFGLAEIRQQLESWKVARNSLIGIIATCKMKRLQGNKEAEIKAVGKWFSPQVWAIIQQLLHEIANEAIKNGCIYVGTDCYMFRINSHVHKFVDYLNNFGLKHEIFYGVCSIYDWQVYEMPICRNWHNGELVPFRPRNLERITQHNEPRFKLSQLYRKAKLASTHPINNLRETPPVVAWWSKLPPCHFQKPRPKNNQQPLPLF